jgi:hypothetical protein
VTETLGFDEVEILCRLFVYLLGDEYDCNRLFVIHWSADFNGIP